MTIEQSRIAIFATFVELDIAASVRSDPRPPYTTSKHSVETGKQKLFFRFVVWALSWKN
jgi:hypothetical protein